MKLSILGCNGFLSTAIAKYANYKDWTLYMYGLDEPKGHSYDDFIKCNLMETEIDYGSLIDSDIIVYAIGAGIQSNLKESYNFIYNLNVTVPVSICNKLKELGYNGCFISFGSVFEMGETKVTRLFNEEDILTSSAPAPNDYVVSKRMLTRFVTSYKHNFTHWHFILPTIYGPGENTKRLIPYTINAIKNGEKLKFTSGGQTRQYIFVDEVPRIIEMAFENMIPSGLYNIQGNETLTVREIVEMIHHILGRNVQDDCFGKLQRDDVAMNYLALNGEKVFKATGFKSFVKISNVISLYLDRNDN